MSKQQAHICNCELNLTFRRQVLLVVTIETATTVEHISQQLLKDDLPNAQRL